MPVNFFTGFVLKDAANPQETWTVLTSRSVDGALHLELSGEDDLPAPAALIELTTGEAAPVLGARLLTQTPPGTAFPQLHFRLATTRATNALLERRGSRVALFITRGFGDLLLIGDQRRRHLFALQHEPREVHYEIVSELDERLDATGKVLCPVDESFLIAEAVRFLSKGITTTAAVCLLHSDVNPSHERQVRNILIAAGFTHVSLSSELAPFIRILPRAQSAVANAYLTGPVEQFIADVSTPLASHSSLLTSPLHLMTSAGAIEPAPLIRPKDLLLSGPAAGVLGALHAAKLLGHERVITFDMGGTSTDVARLDGAIAYRFTQTVGGVTLLSPSAAIETVAAGGGSICHWTPQGLAVGPHSAGSDPGPACYGKGGPLTITDVNLLLGRFDPVRASIPLSREAAELRLVELLDTVNAQTQRALTSEALLHELLALATERMADAIRKISVLEGYDPADYALLAFGGAGPQHACDVAARLGITTILAPHHAGILSAIGLQEARPERLAETQVLRLLDEAQDELPSLIADLAAQAMQQLAAVTGAESPAPILRRLAELRLRGQDTPLQIEFTDASTLHQEFAGRFARLFGYTPPKTKPIELVTLRVIAQAPAATQEFAAPGVPEGRHIAGPAMVQDAFSTLIISDGWQAAEYPGRGWVLRSSNLKPQASSLSADILRHRFTSIVEEMGALLRRTALSTNIRERLDYSCALLDHEGTLIVSAPHIPVHLGALGVCVREVMRAVEMREGDTVVTNHPAFGGSHLPDVTLITPVHDTQRCLLGFVANRAHHAEIGGLSPGSMPANATRLTEEGVVIAPMLLRRDGAVRLEAMRELLLSAAHPTRAVEDNLADLQAQLAANLLGAERLRALAIESPVLDAMEHILDESHHLMQRRLATFHEGAAEEVLDDGRVIRVHLAKQDGRLIVDFTGTSPQHPANLNATPAILRSAVLYVLRLALQEDLPLNEGLLADVDIRLPEGSLLNPTFSDDPSQCPAVVGGNVEISQRVVDTLLKALGLQACSQGTMNNLLFGNARFGYYETICGGTGAGPGYDGEDACHSHMTNTAITDPEVIERRYPVRLREFSIRHGSGGTGQWHGGAGAVREFEFLEPLTVSLLTQHRRTRPYGMEGGAFGTSGTQTLTRAVDGSTIGIASSATFDVAPGDRLRIETPGGGGWGSTPTQPTCSPQASSP